MTRISRLTFRGTLDLPLFFHLMGLPQLAFFFLNNKNVKLRGFYVCGDFCQCHCLVLYEIVLNFYWLFAMSLCCFLFL